MLRKYSFKNRINESKEIDPEMFEKARHAVNNADIFDEVYIQSKAGGIIDINGWKVAEVYGKPKDDTENDLVLYSFSNDNILTPIPIKKIIKYMNSGQWAVAVGIDEENHEKYNIVNENGCVLDDWADHIYGYSNRYNNMIINYDDGGSNLIDPDGNNLFPENVFDMSEEGDYIIIDDNSDMDGIYSRDGKCKIEGYCNRFECVTVKILDNNGYKYDVDFYVVDYSQSFDIYDASLNLLSSGVDDGCEEVSDNSDESQIYKIEKFVGGEYYYNILARNGKLLFDSSADSVEGWATMIEDHPEFNKFHMTLIEVDGRYNLLDCRTIEFIDDIWYDNIKFVDLNLFRQQAILFNKDGKCNIMLVPYYDHELNKEFVFKEPVDNIKMYDDFGSFIFVTKDDQDYILWRNNKLMSVPFDKLWPTEVECTYIYMIDGKFDLINTDYDYTFCERYMNGEKFDACFDVESYYPLFEKDGKMTFVDAETFKPALNIGHNTVRWFDDADPVDYEQKDIIFNVVEDGVEKKLDDWGQEFDEE